jgi:hypothetical protein
MTTRSRLFVLASSLQSSIQQDGDGGLTTPSARSSFTERDISIELTVGHF